MTDPYRLDPAAEPATPAPERGGGPLRAFLWVVLVLAAAGNLVASLAELSTLLRLGFGLIAVACIGALVVDHLRRRRR